MAQLFPVHAKIRITSVKQGTYDKSLLRNKLRSLSPDEIPPMFPISITLYRGCILWKGHKRKKKEQRVFHFFSFLAFVKTVQVAFDEY